MMYFSRITIRPEIFKGSQFVKIISESPYNMHRLLWDLFEGQSQRSFLYREEIASEQIGTGAGVRGEPVYYVVSATQPILEKPLFSVETKTYQPKLQNGDRVCFELRANPVITTKIERKNPERFLAERRRRQVADKNKLTKKRARHDVAMNSQRTLLTSLCMEFDLQSQLPPTPKKHDFKKVLLAYGGTELDRRLTNFLKKDYRYSDSLRQSSTLSSKLEWSLKANIDAALEKWVINQGERYGFEIVTDKNHQLKLQNSAYHWNSIKAKKGKKSGFSSVDFIGELEIIDKDKFCKALFNGIGRAKAFGCGLMLVRRI
jgi:CRISPR system Cascade subunit CasE